MVLEVGSSPEREARPQTVRVHEGSTVRDVARLLQATGLARAKEVLRLNTDRLFLRQQQIEAPSLEGYLYPDTYHFAKSTSVEEILARMVRRLREEVPGNLWKEAEAKGLTPHQALTLASIIQKEAAGPRDMPVVSAVFWNRMHRGMRLQADPTVLYVLGKRQRLTPRDLRVNSPFNTYRHAGLPPGPIANPGKPAIVAALRPAEAQYLFFSKRGRRNVFATTPGQHRAGPARPPLAEARMEAAESARPRALAPVAREAPEPRAREASRVPGQTVSVMGAPGF